MVAQAELQMTMSDNVSCPAMDQVTIVYNVNIFIFELSPLKDVWYRRVQKC